MIILSRTYVQHEYNAQRRQKKSRTPSTLASAIDFSPAFLKNEPMKKLWFPVLAALVLAGCTPDHTLDTLIPRNSLAVVLVDQPGLVSQALGSGTQDFPLASLDGGKPWAGAAVPANPPGFMMALALADRPEAWTTVSTWARDRGGLEAIRVGTYAVLFSPGLATPAVLDVDRRFDLARVRAPGDPVAVYLDVKNIMDEADFPEALRPVFPFLPWAEKNLTGLRLGFSARDGGLEVRLASDWREGSQAAGFMKVLPPSVDLAPWTGLLSIGDGFGAVVSLPPQALQALGATMSDPALKRRWSVFASLVGPRMALSLTPRSGDWAWSAAVEATDPQAIRQALKTLVASGDLQKNFPTWALDGDTALIYQDKIDGLGGIRTELTLGTNLVHVAYGQDRVVLAGGLSALESLRVWKEKRDSVASWAKQVPQGASMVATGLLDGLGAKGAVKVLADGNVELRVWVDAVGLKAWEERLPQVLLSWLSGPGGWTRGEP